MDYKTLIEIPLTIREFYHEEIRNEQVFEEDGITPVLASEDYIYFDMDMIEQTATRQVPVFQDNTYIVENTRWDLKSWQDVDAVVINHKGRNDTVVNSFVSKAILSDKWKFHDEWLVWNDKLELVISDRDTYTPITDEEGILEVAPNFEEIILNIQSKEPIITVETLELETIKWQTSKKECLPRLEYTIRRNI